MAQTKAKPVTRAGETRLHEALARYGMLPIQGQHDIPSIADLLEGAPIRTRGFSWDYVPAWDMSEALAADDDKVLLKLFRGGNTLVTSRHWPAVQVLARENVRLVSAGEGGQKWQEFLQVVSENPGLPGASVKIALGLDGDVGRREFQRTKTLLERVCVIWGEEQTEAESHSHDLLWYPWDYGKVSKAMAEKADLPSLADAERELVSTVAPASLLSAGQRRNLFPVLRFVSEAGN